jgi:mRNA-degrading endonuclease toxin of MazEF toxin-antitoxin module
VVVSRDEQNVELDVVIVVPLSSKVMPDMEPYRVHIPKRGRLQKSSDALPYHIRAISKKRVIEKLGALDEKEMERLKTAICEVI